MLRGESDTEETSIHSDYVDLIGNVQAEDKITGDSGWINLEVLKKHEHMMTCRLLDG